MISLISLFVAVFLTLFKCLFWICKKAAYYLFIAYRFLVAIVPITAIVWIIFFALEIGSEITHNDYIPKPLPYYLESTSHAQASSSKIFDAESFQNGKKSIKKRINDSNSSGKKSIDQHARKVNESIQKNINNQINNIANDTKKTIDEAFTAWWSRKVEELKQREIRNLLIVLGYVLLIPVSIISFSVSAVFSAASYLEIAIIFDMVWYAVAFCAFRKRPVQVFDDRLRILFPKQARQRDIDRYEGSYASWLRRHHNDFDDDTFDGKEYDNNEEYDDCEKYDDSENDEYEISQKHKGLHLGIRRHPSRGKLKITLEYDDYFDKKDDMTDSYNNFEDQDMEDLEYENSDYLENNDYSGSRDCYRKCNYQKEVRDSKIDNYDEKENNKKSFDFFAGCNTRESIKKKYYVLVKLYHPDNLDGDTSALYEIVRQYKEKMKETVTENS